MEVTDGVALLQDAYRLFNDRRVDDLLAMMTEDVEWPNVADGMVLHGKDSVRSYWAGQFARTSPQVMPTEFIAAGDDLVVAVDQQIFDLAGRPLAPRAVVFHRYGFAGVLIRRMVVFNDRAKATEV